MWVPTEIAVFRPAWKGGGIYFRLFRDSTFLTGFPDCFALFLSYSPGHFVPKQEKICQFLVVEDNRDEAFLIEKALHRISADTRCAVCRNLNEAKDYLRGAGIYADRLKFPRPDIIVADLRIGLESGLDLLDWAKEDPELRHLEFIILTGSAAETDVTTALRKGARKVIQKPYDLHALMRILSELVEEFCSRK